MRVLLKTTLLTLILGFVSSAALAREVPAEAKVINGVLTWSTGSKQGQEVVLFGVNYAVPFAYSYRALQKRGIDHKAAIDMDVAHIARLGLDAYRVHVWDRQISDDQGNLLVNEHLQLFDYLLAKLAEKGIRVIITPIAWWGSGYPEPDPDEPGFSSLYSKGDMNQNRQAISAQQRYLRQFFAHINPYTQKRYGQDPNVLAIELFNEPRHEDGLKDNEDYIEGLIKTVREQGITLPLYYNISEQGNNPDFAARLCATSIDGIAYQWYPAGLVKNAEFTSNLLATVAHYSDPFADIAACQTKAKMIYEFDAADTGKSVMYPAMARSFREAGFQWASQFAYDPAAIADTNSDYNTHYLNLLYTPAKAISFMIAAEAFRQMPRLEKQANYPQSNHFMAGTSQVSVDYQQNVSVLVSAQQFLYSNTTEISPPDSQKLEQIAGLGTSPVVDYQGTGAYFLDKIGDELWRLEVYPDLLPIQDPYQPASLKREVGRLYSSTQQLNIKLADLGKRYFIKGLNAHNELFAQAEKGTVWVRPGVYLLSRNTPPERPSVGINTEFLIPQLSPPKLAIHHQAQREMNLADKLTFSVEIGSEQIPNNVALAIRYRGHKDFTLLDMQRITGNTYTVRLPVTQAQWAFAGQLEYGFVVTLNGKNTTFPGAIEGSPLEWDFVSSVPFWTTELRPLGAPVTLFDALADHDNLIYPKNAESNWQYVSGQQGQGLALRLSTEKLTEGENPLLRLTLAPDNPLALRNLAKYNTLAIKLRAIKQAENLQFSLLDSHGLAYGITLEVSTDWQYLVVPVSALKALDTLFPKSYPSFMPASYKVADEDRESHFTEQLNLLQGMQLVLLGQKYAKKASKGWHGIDISEVKLLSR
jgi:hypothetical protein